MKRLLTLFIVCLLAGPALGADPAEPEPFREPTADGWRAAISTYVWGARLSGETAVGGLPPVDVDVRFSDTLSNLDFAAFGTAEIGYRRWLAFSDFQYVKVTIDQATPFGVLATRQKLRSETVSFLFTGGYRMFEADRWTLDALAGGRLHAVSNRISVTGGILGSSSGEVTETWVDPIVGAKARALLTPSFGLVGWGFVGGFGASSDIDWDVLGALTWSPHENVSAVFGYRASGVDYRSGGFVYDTIQQGPVIGGIIRF